MADGDGKMRTDAKQSKNSESKIYDIRFIWTTLVFLGVVIEMVILEQKNCVRSINSKIPEYARDYKKEYLLIIGINKEFRYFVEHIHESPIGLFENHRVARIKYFIKRFLKGEERGKLQDTSNFEINNIDVDNLIKIKKNFLNFNQYINFCKGCFDDEDASFIDPYPGFKIFMMISNYFLVSLK